jgi:hypothetical protein
MRREILRTLVAIIAVYAVSFACSGGSSGPGLLAPPGAGYPAPITGGGAGDPGAIGGDTNGRPGGLPSGRDGSSAVDPGSGSLFDGLADIIPDAEAALNEAGSRLKLRVLAASDGARQFNGFHDTQVDEQCWFAETGPGRQHCIPVRVMYLSNHFADAQCTQRIGTVQGTDCVPRFARWSEVVGCHTTIRMYEVGQAFPADAPAYIRKGDGECAEVSISDSLSWYRTRAEVPLDNFVSASVEVE